MTFSEWDQTALRRAWEASRQLETASSKVIDAREIDWMRIRELFQKHGELTCGDVATLLKAEKKTVAYALRARVTMGDLNRDQLSQVSVYTLKEQAA